VRATPSVALQVLRSAEETLLRGATHNLIVRTRTEVAFYILNQKRAHLSELEERFGVAISILADDTISGTTTFAIDRGEPAIALERKGPATGVKIDTIMPVDEPIEVDPTVELELEAEIEAEEDEDRGPRASEESSEEANGRRRRRRRRRRGGRSGEARDASGAGSESDEFGDEDEGGSDEPLGNGAASQEPGDSGFASPPEAAAAYAPMAEAIEFARPDTKAEDRPGSLDGSRENRASERPSQTESASQAEAPQAQAEPEAAPPIPEPEPEPEPVAVVLTPPDPNRPKRGGWWSKAKAAIGGS
jgi:ribonuclease E